MKVGEYFEYFTDGAPPAITKGSFFPIQTPTCVVYVQVKEKNETKGADATHLFKCKMSRGLVHVPPPPLAETLVL